MRKKQGCAVIFLLKTYKNHAAVKATIGFCCIFMP